MQAVCLSASFLLFSYYSTHLPLAVQAFWIALPRHVWYQAGGIGGFWQSLGLPLDDWNMSNSFPKVYDPKGLS